MPAEETQELGRQGVFLFKRWLESTTYMDLSWNSYGTPAMCEVQHLGGVKTYDLAGILLLKPNVPVVVECKRYSSPGAQPQEFEELLAIAYGAALHDKNNNRRDAKKQFVWATTHPFNQTKWSKLTSIETLREAVKGHPELAGDEPFDEDLGRKIVDRIWLLVWHEKQNDISLTSTEVLKVWELLARKEVHS
jgi:hypothetical protein